MAKQATALGFENGDAWAFGPASRGVRPKAVRPREPEPEVEPLFEPLVESVPAVDSVAEDGHEVRAADYAQPAVLLADYGQPAVFVSNPYSEPAQFLAEPSEPPASERDMWDQLPTERPRRSRRYVGKHRA